jgi:CheY-like chemotaxis protein
MTSLMSLISFASISAARLARGTYLMHFAASGAEALDRLSEEIRPAVVAVLSDINMPEMDGLQLLARRDSRISLL